ncbi:MAG: ribbon-helix-helix protein, CopG family [Methylacidiphilales bacterium]|nr:ribbon-helix-helix protein, CopG family [Candidatus Methylacidiphilales bacterium]
MRTIVDLPKEQIEALDNFAKAKGISRAAAVREAVATYLPARKKRRNLNYWLKHPAFGSEKRPKGFDSIEYVRKLRAEWDHRADECGY